MSESEPPTILVVDDEALNRDLLSRRLERKGYCVLVAADGYSALGMVDVEKIDVVILDIMMPGIDGLKVLERIREKRSDAELPVIMASALSDSSVIVEALGAGANDYITKPLDFPVVVARIENQLRQRTHVGARDSQREPDPGEIGPGVTLGGRYQLADTLGEGGSGIVYRARHVELEFDVAVKLLHGELARDPNFLERFRREGVTTCRVQHPNAVRVYDFQATDTGIAYLVMEYLHGQSLADYLVTQPPLTPERTAQILLPTCDALEAAHRAGVLHRDIKPENLFLEQIGERETLKILDFGIADLIGATSTDKLTKMGQVVGSPYYMAPERLLGGAADDRADVFSVGVVAFRMLAGFHPFAGQSVEELLGIHVRGEVRKLELPVPDEIAQLVAQAMSRDPRDRPSVREFAGLFGTAIRGYRDGDDPIAASRSGSAVDGAAGVGSDSPPADPDAPTRVDR